MELNKLNWKIGGSAGQGIMVTGLVFAKTCTRGGLHIFDYIEYPSLIKGGHNCYQVRVEPKEVLCQIKSLNMLVALNKETIYIHEQEMAKDCIIIYDHEIIPDVENLRSDVKLAGVPMARLAKSTGLNKVVENTIALGATFALLKYDLQILQSVLSDTFKHSGEKIVAENKAAAKAGYDYARKNLMQIQTHQLKPLKKTSNRMVLTGNEAISLGAIHAGCSFYSAYPMTPASSILHFMAAHSSSHNIVVKHVEDEISAISNAIGAAHVGVRAMTGTSGGGYALMSESLSLAGITETGVVIVEAMRGGPGTGVPTWTEQADLKFVLHGGHGDFPKFVVAPGDVEEAYELTKQAFNMAEKYQTPTVVLSDKYLSESHKSQDFYKTPTKIDRGKLLSQADLLKYPEGSYRRYDYSDDGVSPRSLPGMKNGMFLANSDEHTPYGYSNEEIPNRNAQHEKRMLKMRSALNDIPLPKTYGSKDANLTIIGFGSVKGPVLEAIKWAERENIKVKYVHLTWLSPFPAREVQLALQGKNAMVIENNISGQLYDLIREKTGVASYHYFRRYDGRPFYPEDIVNKIKQVVKNG